MTLKKKRQSFEMDEANNNEAIQSLLVSIFQISRCKIMKKYVDAPAGN